MISKTKGIVLHYIKYSETSVIVKIYTEVFGLQSYIIRNLRAKKAKNKMSLIQHLSFVDMVVYHNNKSKIHNIKEIKSAYQFKTIPFDIVKSSLLVFINEFLYKTIYEEEPNKNLYNFIVNSVEYLDNTETNINNFHLFFITRLTKFLGFLPINNFSDKNNIFNMNEGEFQNEIPNHSNFLNKNLSYYFSLLLSANIDNTDSIKLSLDNKNLLIEKIIEYYKIHIPGFKDIKSHRILKATFH